jgi:phosphoribosylamine--glycine ligase
VKVLVIGKGGREHALVWKLAQSRRVTRVFCAPGNAGTALEGVNVPCEPHEFDRIIRFVKKEDVGLVVVGPEDPLAAGITDTLAKEGIRVFGPSKAAAQLEASKVFTKELLWNCDIPTAEFRVFDHPEAAKRYIETRDYPVVVKADGLAGGKGVIVCKSVEEGLQAVDLIMIREAFGNAGRRVVVEKRLDGQECSVMALVSGRTILTLPTCQDHKALLEGDKGPNTGGMGAYCPTSTVSPEQVRDIENTILVPVVHALKRGRMPFRGLLYAGLMLTPQGPRVLEFNVRFGDPETQALLMRLQGDLLDLLDAVVDSRLDQLQDEQIRWDPRPAVTVVLASEGYPGKFPKGKLIHGLADVKEMPDVKVFHAGTKLVEKRAVTDGGRVLNVTALGENLAAAKARAYEAVQKLHFAGMVYRKDIGDKGLTPPAP